MEVNGVLQLFGYILQNIFLCVQQNGLLFESKEIKATKIVSIVILNILIFIVINNKVFLLSCLHLITCLLIKY